LTDTLSGPEKDMDKVNWVASCLVLFVMFGRRLPFDIVTFSNLQIQPRENSLNQLIQRAKNNRSIRSLLEDLGLEDGGRTGYWNVDVECTLSSSQNLKIFQDTKCAYFKPQMLDMRELDPQ